MRRADRLFDIIQILSTQKRALTARALAERLEVTPRTIYRDVAALQARRVPIEGAPGVGYVLRRGYELPPLAFTVEELEAIAVGARMVPRLRDAGLNLAAGSVLSKVMTVIPDAMRGTLAAPRIWVSDGMAARPAAADPADVRSAIRAGRKLRISYVDERGKRSRRTIWPIAMVYYVDVTLVAAWCELRWDFRHFRIERVRTCTVLDERYPNDGEDLMSRWMALRAPGAATA